MVQKAVQRGRSKVCGAKHNERHACARRREDEREQCLARTMLGPCFSVLRRLLGLFAGLEALGALFQVGNAMGAAEMPVAQAAQHEAHFDSILCLAAVTIFCGSCLRHGPSPLNVRRFDRSASVAEHVDQGLCTSRPVSLFTVAAVREAWTVTASCHPPAYPQPVGPQAGPQFMKEIRQGT